jgi:hypothetical protein
MKKILLIALLSYSTTCVVARKNDRPCGGQSAYSRPAAALRSVS